MSGDHEQTVRIVGEPQRKSGGFLKVDAYEVSYSAYSGGMQGPFVREVLERGDAAAILAHDLRSDDVIVVEQFRLPAHLREPGEGWIIEAIAGIIAGSETPEQTALRECREETGLTPANLKPIGTVYPSVGGSTERVFLFYGEVDASGIESGSLAGVDEGEDIRIIKIPRARLVDDARHGRLRDAKLALAGLWIAALT